MTVDLNCEQPIETNSYTGQVVGLTKEGLFAHHRQIFPHDLRLKFDAPSRQPSLGRNVTPGIVVRMACIYSDEFHAEFGRKAFNIFLGIRPHAKKPPERFHRDVAELAPATWGRYVREEYNSAISFF